MQAQARKTRIRSSYFYPYYDPYAWRENGGLLSWSNYDETMAYYDASGTSAQSAVQGIYKNDVWIYSSLWFDLAPLYWLSANIGEHQPIYQPGEITYHFQDSNVFYFTFQQSRQSLLNTFTVKSFNIVIGQIGGYTALIWMVLGFCLDGY